jgi:DNA helicase HerA-like ATPase
MNEDQARLVGRVLGTVDSTPLEFWVALEPGRSLQLDDVVATVRRPPGGEPVSLYGIVSQVRARYEGARFDSDVFLIEDGVLPGEVCEAAQISTTRVEPEVFIPPLPGAAVMRAEGKDRDQALFFDGMDKRLPAGMSRSGEPVFLNLEDHLRDLPALQPLQLRSPGRGGAQHQGADLQRQGRRPAVPGSCQHPAHRAGRGPLPVPGHAAPPL